LGTGKVSFRQTSYLFDRPERRKEIAHKAAITRWAKKEK
jgi:hypothetical protein